MKNKNIKLGRAVDTGVTFLVLIVVSVIFFFPVLWLALSSLSKSSMYSINGFFPTSFTFDNFKTLFFDSVNYNYSRWFLNTLVVAVCSAALGSLLTILTAYCMSRFKFKSRKALMKTTLVLGMFPSFMSMIAVFLLMTQFQLINSHLGLILIYSAGAPMGYLTQKGFFDTIPNSIDEAARIDGASNFTVFWKITMPLSLPIIVFTLLTAFTWPWSDFILPKLLLLEKDYYTVAVGLMSLPESEFTRFAAGSIFIGIPIIILYFLLSRFLISGLSSGAVKE